MTAFRFALDPDSPVPVFHQIVEAVRYRIATGRLGPGQPLPSIRDAGEQLDVHYLTVRRAYQALREEGLVESRRGVGTRVVDRLAGAGPEDELPSRLGSFLDGLLRQARADFGLGPTGLVEALRSHEAGEVEEGDVLRDGEHRPVHVVECNRPQALDYARQLESGAGIRAGTWLLTEEGEPPPGLLVGTYFHFDDLRERWPNRADDMRFVAVSVDPGLRRRVESAIGDGPGRVLICETRETRAHNVLPDVRSLLRDLPVAVDSLLVDRPGSALDRADPDPVLFSPRLWAELEERHGGDPRSLLLRYVIEPAEMAELRANVGARARHPEAVEG